MNYTKAELQEVAKVWDDILLGFDGHHQRHYLGLTIPHPAAPRVMLTVRRIVERVVSEATDEV